MKKASKKKKKLGSFPFISVIFSITLALLTIGVYGLVWIFTQGLTRQIRENIEVQIFLDKPISNAEVTKIQKIITNRPYLLSTEASQSIKHITQEEAARKFIADTGEDFRTFLGDNPLRDVLIIKVSEDYQNMDSLELIKKELSSIKGVFEVTYIESLVKSIQSNLKKLGLIAITISVVLLVIVIILINNTIKLAMFSQRFLIRSMQLVGAKRSFILSPFIWRSVLYGFIAGTLAALGIYFLNEMAMQRIEDLVNFYSEKSFIMLIGLLYFLGITIATLSTFAAVRRYLKLSLDELY